MLNRVIFLDSGPLGIITNARTPATALTAQVVQWAVDLTANGHKLIVPAVADFEVRRELVRSANTASIALLDAWNVAQPDRYLPVTDSSLKLAAKLWAQARNAGNLPADPKELNGDVLIAAQVIDYQANYGIALSDIVIATVNVGHISLFAPADVWTNIKP